MPTLRQARRDLRYLRGDLKKAAKAVVRQAVTEGKARAYEWSSGPYSLAQLAKMDHPYARRHATPLLDPATINVQTGTFRRHWAYQAPYETSTGIKGSVYNDAEIADTLMSGTWLMHRRPIDDRLGVYMFDLAKREMDVRISAAIKRFQ